MNLNQRIHDTALDNHSRRSKKKTKRASNEFSDLGITPNLVREIDKLNFEHPTPVQKESIPPAIQGDDIIVVAKTGSGKTIAYGIPTLQRLSKMKSGIGLVLVPTRELAIQVDEALQIFSRPLHMHTTVLIGGASISLQRDSLRKNPRIIVATPGRLMDHIERKTVDLSEVGVFILDEADRMLDMGFIPDIKKIMKSIPDNRQTMLFSATMPKEVEAIAEKLMENPTRIETDRSGVTPAEVSHEMFFVNNQDKKRLLAVQLKQCSGPVLVFTRTKHTARKLTGKINEMGFTAAQIHSDRSQGQRRFALEGFKRGRYQILIATDIAARGIDVLGIELVVNYDMPATSEDYVHRIGRTGRAGKTGHAVSYATIAQKGSIRNLERFMNTKLAISVWPTLPSEMNLLKEIDQLNFGSEYSREEKRSKRKHSKERLSKRSDFKKVGKKPTKSERKDFQREDSKQKKSKRKYSRSTDLNQNDSNNENSFRSNFKKKRSSKKKSVGQGPRRKRSTKRT
ncbi:MAG: DEAD/DEAH box helicase [Candidatus Zixiibacteriota bacterium]